MKPQVDALIFDLGGVLVEVDWSRAFAAWSERSGVPQAELARRFRRDDAYRAHECGTLGDAEFFSGLRDSLGIGLREAELLEGWNAILGPPLPGAPSLLRQAAGHRPVYVFSNTNAAHVAHWKPLYRELLSPVREVICSCELGCRKPDRDAFRRVAERIGVAPARIAFFDDLDENVAGARAAGLQAFHVPTPGALQAALAALPLSENS